MREHGIGEQLKELSQVALDLGRAAEHGAAEIAESAHVGEQNGGALDARLRRLASDHGHQVLRTPGSACKPLLDSSRSNSVALRMAMVA